MFSGHRFQRTLATSGDYRPYSRVSTAAAFCLRHSCLIPGRSRQCYEENRSWMYPCISQPIEKDHKLQELFRFLRERHAIVWVIPGDKGKQFWANKKGRFLKKQPPVKCELILPPFRRWGTGSGCVQSAGTCSTSSRRQWTP